MGILAPPLSEIRTMHHRMVRPAQQLLIVDKEAKGQT
jgi:hypothetical protein